MSAYSDAVNALNPHFYWRLGEASGTVAVDETANNLDGTYINTPTLGETGLITSDADTSIALNGTDEYITLNPDTVTEPTGMTISMWITPDVVSRAKGSLATAYDGAVPEDYQYQLYVHGTGDPTTGGQNNIVWRNCGAPNGCQEIYSPSDTIAIGDRHFIVATTEEGGNDRLYIDGCLVAVSGRTLTDIPDWTRWVVGHGSYLTFGFFDGHMDEVAVWTSALSADDISSLYTVGVDGVGDGCLQVSIPETCNLRSIDEILFVDATNADVTVTIFDGESLPAIGFSHIYRIKRIDDSDNTVTVDPSPTTIDGLTTLTLEPWDAIAIVTDGYSWFRV